MSYLNISYLLLIIFANFFNCAYTNHGGDDNSEEGVNYPSAEVDDHTHKPPQKCLSNEVIKHIMTALEVINLGCENIRLKLDTLGYRFNQDLMAQKKQLLDGIKDMLEGNESSIKTRVLNVRSNEPNNFYTPNAIPFTNHIKPPLVKAQIPRSCTEALKNNQENGIYKIKLSSEDTESFEVYCMADPDNGEPWTIIQRRQDGSIDFYRDWNDYRNGFGSLTGEFFIGLEKIHRMTRTTRHELWIIMEDWNGNQRMARYNGFAIGDEASKYQLALLGDFSGDAGDSLRSHLGNKFSTRDSDNDNWVKNCAAEFHGAWWYGACHQSNLNGKYMRGEYGREDFGKGINWKTWHGHQYSLKTITMAIRPIE